MKSGYEYQNDLWTGLFPQETELSIIDFKIEILFGSYKVFPITREPIEQAERQ